MSHEARISDDALRILNEVAIEENRVTLNCSQLERTLYEEVNEVLTRLGGKWKGGRIKAHLFPYDPAPLLHGVIATEEMPPKNPTAFFPTPSNVVADMLEEVHLSDCMDSEWRILEPSAGTGAFATAIRDRAPHAHLDVIECLPVNASVLRSKGFTVHQCDFLTCQSDRLYHTVIMNPPFAVKGDALAYITHIEHAWSLLRDYGQLIAICPTGFTYRSDKKNTAFREFVMEYGEWWMLPDDAFKESGTMVKTAVVKVTKTPVDQLRQPYSGWHCWHCWCASLWEDNEAQHVANRDKLMAHLSEHLVDDDIRQRVRDHYNTVAKAATDPILLNADCHAELFATLVNGV